jgi:hypothetical protein
MDHADWDSDSFDHPVHFKIVKGLTFATCKEGNLTEDVGKEFDKAVDHLVKRGVKAITGDCGFMQQNNNAHKTAQASRHSSCP